MNPRLTVTVVVVLSLMAIAVHADVCASYSDGCSVPFHFDFFYKRLFTPSCYRHDVCYGCGAIYGIDKDDCDNAFLWDMKTACASANRRCGLQQQGAESSLCTIAAQDVYYAAVHFFASSHFHDTDNPESYCTQSWVRSCLPHN